MHSKISDTTATKVNCAQLDISLGLPPHMKDIFVGNGAVHLVLVSTMISQPIWSLINNDDYFHHKLLRRLFWNQGLKERSRKGAAGDENTIGIQSECLWWCLSSNLEKKIIGFWQKFLCSKFWGFLMHLIDGNLICKFKSLFIFYFLFFIFYVWL